jgi:hypothetical protein
MDPKMTDIKESDQAQKVHLKHPFQLPAASKSPGKIQTIEALESFIGHSLEGLESQFSRFMTVNSRGLSPRKNR